MDDQDRAMPQDWLDALDEAEADVAAGRVISGEELRRRMRLTLVGIDETTPDNANVELPAGR